MRCTLFICRIAAIVYGGFVYSYCWYVCLHECMYIALARSAVIDQDAKVTTCITLPIHTQNTLNFIYSVGKEMMIFFLLRRGEWPSSSLPSSLRWRKNLSRRWSNTFRYIRNKWNRNKKIFLIFTKMAIGEKMWNKFWIKEENVI